MSTRFRRQLLPLLAALTLPSIVIGALGYSVIVTGGAMAAKDDGERTLEEISRGILASANQIKLRQLQNPALDGPPADPRDPGVIFTAQVSGDQLVFWWDVDSAASVREAIDAKPFADPMLEGRRAELGRTNAQRAVTAYEAALRVATNDTQREIAQSSLARALVLAGETAKARALDLELLKLSSNVTDE